MSDELSQRTKGTLFNDLIVQIQTEAAKQNAIRLFYLGQTQSAISPELYNNSEDPQIRLNLKVAVCLVLSEASPGTEQRYHLTGAVDDLLRKVSRILETQPQLGEGIRSVLEPVRKELDDIALLPDLQTIESETLYQHYSRIFIAKDVLANDGMAKQAFRCPLTREDGKSHLVQSYGDDYVDYHGTREVAGWLTRLLELPYDQPRVIDRELDVCERGKTAGI